MDTDLERQCPYAPYTSVLTVIRHMRERDLKEPVTSQWITTIGVAEGNASRTIQALRFLDLLDEGGYLTPNFKTIGNAPDEEYPGLLAQTLQGAYKQVFRAMNPTTASDQQFENAFRYYQPRAQRERMIMLFKGLCREAGIIAGGAPETTPRPRTASPKSSPSTGAKKGQSEPKTDSPLQHEVYQPTEPPITNRAMSNQEFALLHGLLSQLPADKKKWTQARRDKWLQAITANVDLLIDVVDSEDDMND